MPTNRILKQPKSLGLAAVLFATFLVLILVLTPQPVNIQAAANVQPQLLSLAASTPKTVVRVMIHKANTDADVVGLVTQAGGMVIHDLHIVNAVVAEMEAGTAVALANNPTIAGINLDGYLVSSDATIHTVRDDFNKRLFSNNDGTTNWAGDWIEIGDDANPGRGDIRMMSDGTLRLKDDNRSLQRAVDLTGAATAVLSLDYRRDGISGSQDYITLEVSADGGQSWTELNRFAGPDSDSVFQHASYDITAYTSPKTIIRFVNSNQLGNYDILYLDFVQIEFTVGTSGNEDTGDNSPPLTTPPTSSGRITEGLQVLYTFDESNGTTIYDNSGVGTPLDLTIENNSYSWSNGDLSHTQANRAANEQDSNKIYQACTASNEISLEAWITPLDN
ncbi:MAG: hypothetical protein KC413_21815, partial [Anaerolineales bacterium]|nr:hypothetical protein [Anaerolineales bacterium]